MKRIATCLFLVCAGVAGVRAQESYTAHEWGTFTSVQGGDGKLLEWSPLQSSLLPGFVHHYMSLIKGNLVTLQRMETPVIYFHAAHDFKVDVNVRFPQGSITEWYPQAAVSDIFNPHTIAWSNLTVLADAPGQRDLLPRDTNGSHYFTAREAVSQSVRTAAQGASEVEKFLFYRGAGSFQTPLRASVNGGNDVVLENTGLEKLSHLFIVSIHDGRGSFLEVDSLKAHSSMSQALPTDFPLAELQKKISHRMAKALAAEGLQADEAQAMVDTWKDSWFTEDGERVLYILPRTWTDEILPLTLSPAPRELVRVMVGRAEILTPQRVAGLRQILLKAEAGDAAARAQSKVELKALGRFAWPALQLAKVPASTNLVSLFSS